jgi:hypothetical protein
MKNLIWIATAILLTGCARGGGIGLQAIVADAQCEQQGLHLGTPEYAACRSQIAYHQGMVNAAMQAQLARQAEIARQNQPQTCSYNGQTIGGITSGTATCR